MQNRQVFLGLALICSICLPVDALLPIVVWHALGSNCCEEYTVEFINMLKKEFPNVPIVSVRVGKTLTEDSTKSFFDDANRQIGEICLKLRTDPALKNGFNAVGLSQGGLLMRALVEKCNNLNVKTLTTFGSPLQGVSAFPGCVGQQGWAKWSPGRIFRSIFRRVRFKTIPCSVMTKLVSGGVYSQGVQKRIMPAQYYKDPKQLAAYLKENKFLVDINNEREKKNQQYKKNFLKLEKFVMFSFQDEEIVYPQESTNFGYFLGNKVVPMRQLPIYKEDWIGLKELDEKKAIVQIKVPGEHLAINQETVKTLSQYLV